MPQSAITKDLIKQITKQIDQHEEKLIDQVDADATDFVRDHDWSQCMLEVLMDEFDYYQHDIIANPSLEFTERQNFTRLVDHVASNASLYSLPIDTQLIRLSQYLQNSLEQNQNIDPAYVKELLTL